MASTYSRMSGGRVAVNIVTPSLEDVFLDVMADTSAAPPRQKPLLR